MMVLTSFPQIYPKFKTQTSIDDGSSPRSSVAPEMWLQCQSILIGELGQREKPVSTQSSKGPDAPYLPDSRD